MTADSSRLPVSRPEADPLVSPTCEVIESWNHEMGPDKQTYCGKPTAYYYPAAGNGTAALCNEHAQSRLPYVIAISTEPADVR